MRRNIQDNAYIFVLISVVTNQRTRCRLLLLGDIGTLEPTLFPLLHYQCHDLRVDKMDTSVSVLYGLDNRSDIRERDAADGNAGADNAQCKTAESSSR